MENFGELVNDSMVYGLMQARLYSLEVENRELTSANHLLLEKIDSLKEKDMVVMLADLQERNRAMRHNFGDMMAEFNEYRRQFSGQRAEHERANSAQATLESVFELIKKYKSVFFCCPPNGNPQCHRESNYDTTDDEDVKADDDVEDEDEDEAEAGPAPKRARMF